MKRREKSSRFRKLVILAVLIAGSWAALMTFRVGGSPEIAIDADLPAIGRRTPVRVEVAEPSRGVSAIEVDLVQGDRTTRLMERSYDASPPWDFWSSRSAREEISLEVGSETVAGLEEKDAVIRVFARPAPTWLRKPDPVVGELALPVRLTPPSLQVVSTQHYLAQGGCEVVVYRVGATAVRDGVEAADWWFPGAQLPGGGPQDRFALLAAPYDLEDSERIRLIAVDDVGNRAETRFVDRYIPRPMSFDTIRVNDRFLAKVVPEILSRTPDIADQGSLLDNYLQINRDLRTRNRAKLRELAAGSPQEFLWQGSFLPMRNAQVMSKFADRRTYVYEDQDVDQQDHLGFDLATVRGDSVQAANRGVVVLAQYLGIYGNLVVVDHGYGLMSLYAHLSSIGVEEGELVERGEEVGRTGETGLAGGDHLHFTTLLQGLPVTPVEWWDAHWIRDRLERKLGGALKASS